jgi:hypothetical protein
MSKTSQPPELPFFLFLPNSYQATDRISGPFLFQIPNSYQATDHLPTLSGFRIGCAPLLFPFLLKKKISQPLYSRVGKSEGFCPVGQK